MNAKELQEKLSKIAKDMKLLDSIVAPNFRTKETKLSDKQVQIVRDLFSLFRALNWQLSFNEYKELKYDDTEPIRKPWMGCSCGQPVKIRSCKKEHGDKTYFGILIGDVARSISHSIKDGVVTASHSGYNPAIIVPELGEIVYGCESWWGEIESEEELDKLITDETIKNVWYVKKLKEIVKRGA